MPKIHKLPPHEAQKIAAGEVIERPANVVKELLENALDAGAMQIHIYLEDGGKNGIRIIDNGCGMSVEDATLAFEQYATSKITSVNDLPSIKTFGFRGEALASIAAVSHVIVITKEEAALQGTKLTLKDGQITLQEPISANTGTDISIKDLFYNVPARKKFLKTSETELRQIQQLFQAFCLNHLDVHFKFFSENKILFNCPAVTTVEERTMQLWGHAVGSTMLELVTENKQSSFNMYGLISNHHFTRYDRNLVFFFVNNRWVKHQKLSNSLLKGYMNVLPSGRFPAAFIFITVPSHEIDINIHPRKEEVQFLHPRVIEAALQNAVKETLHNNVKNYLTTEKVEIKPDITQPMSHVPLYNKKSTSFETAQASTIFSTSDFEPSYSKHKQSQLLPQKNSIVQQSESEHCTKSEHSTNIEQSNFIDDVTEQTFSIVGQLHTTYILLEKDDGFVVIDQHAAHERILYELFSSKLEQIATVKLLFAQYITLTTDAITMLEPYLPLFLEYGVDISVFSPTQLIIQATPIHLKNQSLEDVIKDILVLVSENHTLSNEEFSKSLHEKIRAQMACKAAVKAGDILTQVQMEQLIKDLYKTNNVLTCPHGRPTTWHISTYEIEKKFKRKL